MLKIDSVCNDAQTQTQCLLFATECCLLFMHLLSLILDKKIDPWLSLYVAVTSLPLSTPWSEDNLVWFFSMFPTLVILVIYFVALSSFAVFYYYSEDDVFAFIILVLVIWSPEFGVRKSILTNRRETLISDIIKPL